MGAPDGSENLLWLNEDYKGEKFSRSEAEEMWHDVGAIRAGVSPEELALPLIKRPFPQAYEFEGAPLKNVIINNVNGNYSVRMIHLPSRNRNGRFLLHLT